MPVKTTTKYRDLPLCDGKTYSTRFQTGEQFTITSIVCRKATKKFESVDERPFLLYGTYVGQEHLGICMLDPGRLVPEREEIGIAAVCTCCGEEI